MPLILGKDNYAELKVSVLLCLLTNLLFVHAHEFDIHWSKVAQFKRNIVEVEVLGWYEGELYVSVLTAEGGVFVDRWDGSLGLFRRYRADLSAGVLLGGWAGDSGVYLLIAYKDSILVWRLPQDTLIRLGISGYGRRVRSAVYEVFSVGTHKCGYAIPYADTLLLVHSCNSGELEVVRIRTVDLGLDLWNNMHVYMKPGIIVFETVHRRGNYVGVAVVDSSLDDVREVFTRRVLSESWVIGFDSCVVIWGLKSVKSDSFKICGYSTCVYSGSDTSVSFDSICTWISVNLENIYPVVAIPEEDGGWLVVLQSYYTESVVSTPPDLFYTYPVYSEVRLVFSTIVVAELKRYSDMVVEKYVKMFPRYYRTENRGDSRGIPFVVPLPDRVLIMFNDWISSGIVTRQIELMYDGRWKQLVVSQYPLNVGDACVCDAYSVIVPYVERKKYRLVRIFW